MRRDLAAALATAFPTRLYIELQRHHDAEGRPVPEEQAAEGGMIDIAYALDLPLVATNDVYFPKPELSPPMTR
jgi:DNA polymerase-3 subunit alpha